MTDHDLGVAALISFGCAFVRIPFARLAWLVFVLWLCLRVAF